MGCGGGVVLITKTLSKLFVVVCNRLPLDFNILKHFVLSRTVHAHALMKSLLSQNNFLSRLCIIKQLR